MASAALDSIGADNTDAGREAYGEGDLHAVITGNPDGPVTVCAIAIRDHRGRSTSAVGDAETQSEIDYGDGRSRRG